MVHGIAQFEEHFDVKAHQSLIDAVFAIFEYVDTNDDGKVTVKEIMAVAEKHDM